MDRSTTAATHRARPGLRGPGSPGDVLGARPRVPPRRYGGQLPGVAPRARGGAELILQGVDEARPAKNRMHLDILAPDIEAEASRLVTLGATRIRPDPVEEHGSRWIVMADPEGNEFCVCQSAADGTC